ncbi:MAG TPA: helix-turn-helix domain-containing protein [Polyangiaceae bacterium]
MAARRTQEERREGTIRKLLDAATDALIELGYADASVQKICERAGVSQGALFRHFATREELMVAVGQDVGRQTLARYRRDFEALRDREDPLLLAMRLVRDRCRSRLNQAWYELAMAARTSPGLRKGLRPVAARYYEDIGELAVQLLPDLAAAMGDRFAVLVETIVAVFDGESVHRFVLPRPAVDEARLEMLGAFARLVVTPRP